MEPKQEGVPETGPDEEGWYKTFKLRLAQISAGVDEKLIILVASYKERPRNQGKVEDERLHELFKREFDEVFKQARREADEAEVKAHKEFKKFVAMPDGEWSHKFQKE